MDRNEWRISTCQKNRWSTEYLAYVLDAIIITLVEKDMEIEKLRQLLEEMTLQRDRNFFIKYLYSNNKKSWRKS